MPLRCSTSFVRGMRVAVACAVVASAVGCQLTLDLGDKVYVDPPAEGGVAIETDAGRTSPDASLAVDSGQRADAAPIACPTGTKGASLVVVTNPNGGITCIDATEVTRDQYAAFVLATSNGTDVSIQPQKECSWNSNFVPDATCLNGLYPDPFICTGANCGNHPQVCVNWCEAYSYCKWAGKRLCGALKGGALDPAKALDPKESQWSNACTSSNRHTFPYGDAFVAQRCQTYPISSNQRTTASVGGHPDCQSKEEGFKNVLDLSGNASEWEDACLAGASPAEATCFGRGGSFLDETRTRCDSQITFMRGRTEPDLGFRCCGP